MNTTSKTIYHYTDVATFMLFHPGDLTDHTDDPIAWYMDHFRYGPVSKQGKIMAFGTGSDGTFKFRLTLEEMTEREKNWAGQSWTFPMNIRHGSLYLDNSDGLPGLEQQHNPGDFPNLWFELPNGDYSVTVTAIEFYSEPGFDDMSKDAQLPSYVISFNRADGLSINTFHSIPPTIYPGKNESIYLQAIPSQDSSYEPPFVVLETNQYPLIYGHDFNFAIGKTIKLPLTDEAIKVIPFKEGDNHSLDFKKIRSSNILHVLSIDKSPKTLAVLAKISGSSRFKETMIHFNFIGIVRLEKTLGIPNKLLKIMQNNKKTTAIVSAVTWTPENNDTTKNVEEYRQQIIQWVKESDPSVFNTLSLNYDIAKLTTLPSHGHITSWLINTLNISTKERLSLLASPINIRVEKLDAYMT